MKGSGVYDWVTGAVTKEWFGPGIPLTPHAPQTAGRQFDYPTALNLLYYPKRGEGVTFEQLRTLADAYDLMRLAIEKRKDELEFCDWKIQHRNGKESRESKRLHKDLQTPDREHTWHQWQRMLMEEMLVTDAPAIYVRRTYGGDPYSLEIVDGSTIKRLLDETGRTPLEGPAYQQVLKGIVTADFDRSELFYCPRNIRINKVYGYSPVEQVITTIDIALRRQAHQRSYYTEGSVPDTIFGVPDNWDVKQIQEFQTWWNSLFSDGNIANRRLTRFIPGGMTMFNTKEAALKDEYDEWLSRIICFTFSLSPSALVKETNRATAEQIEETSKSSGLEPSKKWLKGVMDRIIAEVYQQPELEFVWEQKDALKPKEQAEIFALYLGCGVMDVNEVRQELGLEARKPEARESEKDIDIEIVEPEPPKTTEKMEKSRCVLQIDHERKTIKKLEEELQTLIEKALELQRSLVILAIEAKLKKAETDWYDILADLGIDFDPYLDDIADILARAARSGGRVAMNGLEDWLRAEQKSAFNSLVNQVNEKAVAWASEHAATLVQGITETSRESLANIISDSIERGLSVDQLALEIIDSHAFNSDRARLIATTELAQADVMGNKIAYAESGVVGGLQWITANGGDEACCEDCLMNDGAVVPIGPGGMALKPYPSGAKGVPAHPRCRCDEIPVLLEDI